VGEDEEDDDDNQTGQGDNGSWSTNSALDGDADDGSRPSSTMSIGPPHGKKCKRTPGTLAPSHQKGHDFWSMVDKWFAARMQPDQLGTPWSSPAWTRYAPNCSKSPLLMSVGTVDTLKGHLNATAQDSSLIPM